MGAAVILAPERGVAWTNGHPVLFVRSWDEDHRVERLVPAGYCGTVAPVVFTNEPINVNGTFLAPWIHDLVVERHGPVTWGSATYETSLVRPTENGEHEQADGRLLWAWDERRSLVAVAAPRDP